MNKQEFQLITEIYKDCIKLKRRKELTEFGEGQLMLCKLLLKLKKAKENVLKQNKCNGGNGE